MWSPATKKLIRELTLPQRRTDRVFNVRSYFSVDGSRLAVFRHLARSGGDSSFATVTLWDSASGNPLPIPQGLDQLTPQGISYWPAFSPDGRQVLVGEYNLVRTWDTATGKPIQSLLIQDRPAASSFSPDGQRIRSIDYNGLLKEWSAQPMNQVAIPLLRVPSNRAIAQSAAVSADGNLVFTVLRGKTDSKTDPSACVVQVWNDQGRFIRSLAAPPRAAKVPPHLHLFSLASSRDGRRVMLYREEANMQPAKFGDALAPDITVWDVDSEKVLLCQTLDMKVGQFNYASVSADGRYVATSHMSIGFALGASPVNPTVRIFDLNAEGRERPPITLPDVLNILGVEFHPDGRRVGIVAALKPDNPDAKFFVWDLENNSVQSTVELPNVGGFQAQILWSPDGKWILFGHKMHRIGPARHDLDRGPAAVIKLEIPAGEWLDERFQVWSPDGKRIAGLVTQGGGAKSTLKMWDAENGREVLRLAVPKNVTALTFRKDGRGLILASTEQLADAPRPGGAENEPNRLNLLLTTLDATPPLDREPKK
jgi:WD40 repeat protein